MPANSFRNSVHLHAARSLYQDEVPRIYCHQQIGKDFFIIGSHDHRPWGKAPFPRSIRHCFRHLAHDIEPLHAGSGQLSHFPMRFPGHCSQFQHVAKHRYGAAFLPDIGERREGRVGIWVADPSTGSESKIGAIGVRITRWVSWHGVALNVEPNLAHFGGIVPCGLSQYGVTSLTALGIPATMQDADVALRSAWEEVFEAEVPKPG